MRYPMSARVPYFQFCNFVLPQPKLFKTLQAIEILNLLILINTSVPHSSGDLAHPYAIGRQFQIPKPIQRLQILNLLYSVLHEI